jgi:cell division septation protein DedD
VEAKKPEMPKPTPESKQPVKVALKEVPPVKLETPKPQVVPPVPPQPQVALSKPEPVSPRPQPASQKPEAPAKPVGESVKPSVASPAPVTKKVSVQKPEAAITALPASSEDGRFSIHVGSFKLKENVDEIVERLQKKGYPVLCSLVDIPGKGELYRVKVGYYANGTEAKQVAAKLKSEEKVFTLVLQR